jgi:signal peptidase II
MGAYVVILVAFAIDRLSKWWVAAYLAEHGPTIVHPWLTLRATYNRGISFGLLQGIGPIVGWLSLFVLFGLLYYLTTLPRRARVARFGLALVIGGAAGNLIDRIVVGQVLDFLETPFRQGVFNAADIFINAGMALFIIATLLAARHHEPESPQLSGEENDEMKTAEEPPA